MHASRSMLIANNCRDQGFQGANGQTQRRPARSSPQDVPVVPPTHPVSPRRYPAHVRLAFRCRHPTQLSQRDIEGIVGPTCQVRVMSSQVPGSGCVKDPLQSLLGSPTLQFNQTPIWPHCQSDQSSHHDQLIILGTGTAFKPIDGNKAAPSTLPSSRIRLGPTYRTTLSSGSSSSPFPGAVISTIFGQTTLVFLNVRIMQKGRPSTTVNFFVSVKDKIVTSCVVWKVIKKTRRGNSLIHKVPGATS